MSASGPGIFDDDLAWDVRTGYRHLLEDRVPDDEATRRTIAEWAGLGPDEEPVFWLALAAAQSALGRLDPEVRDRALAVIDSYAGPSRWAELRTRLTGPQPPRRVVRRPYRYVTDLQPGAVLAWRASTGAVVLLRVVQVRDERDMAAPILEQLAWSGSDVPTEGVLARLLRTAGAVYGPVKLKRRDPDWADVGLTICGTTPPRPGDDGDFLVGTSFLQWAGLPLHLEHAATGRWPEQVDRRG